MLVAVSVDQRLEVRSAADGRLVRRLAAARGEESLGGLDLSPDGHTVYYHRAEAGDDWCSGAAVVEAVPVAGGSPTAVAAGAWPALSPDGRRLAYVSGPRCEAGSGDGAVVAEHAVVVRDLATGEERRWTWRQDTGDLDDEPGWPTVVSWLPDGRRLAYARNLGGGDASRVWLLDTAAPGGELSGVQLGPADDAVSWWDPSATGAGTVLVIEPRWDEATASAHSRVLSVVPGGPDAPTPLLATAGQVVQIEPDPSGRHLLFVKVAGPAGEGRPALYRWSDGAIVEVADGIVEAAW